MKELTYYYQIKQYCDLTDREVKDNLEHIYKTLGEYAFVSLKYPSLETTNHKLFYSRHYPNYVIRLRFLSLDHLRIFKLSHYTLYTNMSRELPNIISKDDHIWV